MASVARKPNGRWVVRWREPSGRQRWQTFPDRDAARAHAKAVEYQLSGGLYSFGAGRLTFATYATEWLSAGVWRPKTLVLYEQRLRLHLLPSLGHRPISDIRTGELQALLRRLTGRLSPATVKNIGAVLSSILAAAVRDRLIPQSPWLGVRVPSADRRIRDPLTAEEVRAVADAIAPHYRTAVLFCAGTGLRSSELFGLTLDRIDHAQRSVSVNRQLIGRDGSRPLFGPPKTRASVRKVPVSDVLLELIAEHVDRYGSGADGLIFRQQSGRPNRATNVGTVWAAALRRVGVADGSHFHDLRHFYASLLIRAGLSVKVVQARLGHATAAETLDTYAHLWPDDADRTRDAVASVELFGLNCDWKSTRQLPE